MMSVVDGRFAAAIHPQVEDGFSRVHGGIVVVLHAAVELAGFKVDEKPVFGMISPGAAIQFVWHPRLRVEGRCDLASLVSFAPI